MDVRLPIESWCSYTVDRFICTMDYLIGVSSLNEIHLGCHVMRNASALVSWDPTPYRDSIDIIVRGFVEAARIAYNASEYPEGRDDSTLVPRSCILYLDNAISYLIIKTYGLKRLNGNNGGNLTSGEYSADFKEAWVDCMVFLRAIRTQYSEKLPDRNNEVISELGVPWYKATNSSRRQL